MTKDKYAGFADRYDLFYGTFGDYPTARTEFFRRLFSQNHVHTVLDCACGTGHDLPLFHSLGCNVFGSDISEAMLSRARENMTGNGIEIDLKKADYRQLPRHYDTQFDAVVCLASAIDEMPNRKQVLRAFESMCGVLRSGGLLVLTQGTSDRQWKARPRFIPAVITHDFSRVFVIDYRRKGATYNILDIFHGESGNNLEVWSIDFAQILLRDNLDELLKASGFDRIDFYGSYTFEPYSKETSDRLITVAFKP